MGSAVGDRWVPADRGRRFAGPDRNGLAILYWFANKAGSYSSPPFGEEALLLPKGLWTNGDCRHAHTVFPKVYLRAA